MRRSILSLAIMSLFVSLATPAQADFTPTTSFDLSTTRVRRNPAVTINLAQEEGEEELATVTLKVPRGFALPLDAAIPNDEVIGQGSITIEAGPACAGAGPISGPATVDVTIKERDRTQDEINTGVRAVWFVDLEPVTRVRLQIRGSASRGWKLFGTIPQNQFTCPPFEFEATILKRSADSGVKIFRNPRKPGNYVFSVTYTGTQGSTATTKQTVQIT